MTKDDVAAILEEIGLLLELKGENPFKTRAYFNGARTLLNLSEDLSVVVKGKRLGELKGIGEALQEKITTLVETGSLPYYEQLKASLPAGLLELMTIPGLGPKKLKLLHEKLEIDTLEKLQAACRDGRVAGLAGMGEKTAANLLAGIEQRQNYAGLHRYDSALALAEDLHDWLRGHPDILRLSLAGSVRRGKEVIKDIDLVGSSKNPEALMADFVAHPDTERILSQGPTKSSILLRGGFQCDLRLVEDAQFVPALLHFTGSKEHNVALRQRAIAQGLKLSEYGLSSDHSKSEINNQKFPTESSLYQELGLDFIPPELRENLGEIEAAEQGTLPRLLEWTDLKGCFHNHTTASDGKNTLREMAEAAASIGLDYFGIADHSKSSVQAKGLDEVRLLAQVEEIRKLNKELDELHLFAGVECDILKNGTLDYEDAVLEQLDYVVASVHSSFTLSEKDMTKRIRAAMENPHVHMIAHLTGRLLLERESYALNIPEILKAAAETGTWIELNASPYRLDLDWRWWRQARDLGVKCVINPDAHSVRQIGNLKLGAQIARKGWLRKEDVINTLSVAQLKELL
ncbi:MAG: DNA polymerase/3'-5' exonuclease PolX [Blastochloris sp.]|nr:DNA polymerase/3'-5' exonuclease PolX [Blastochloris sp.]